MTPATSEDEYVASEASSNASESESETLADLEQLRATVATRSQTSKSTTRPTPASSKKKKPPKKKNAAATTRGVCTYKQNVSCWVELACKGEVTAADLLKSCYGSEFACLHNRDSSDFMNELKFKRFILKRTNDDVPFSWDLLDGTGRHIVMEIVEDEGQGPSKEW
jgi:hypothetical protein